METEVDQVAEQLAAQMAGSKVLGDYVYLNRKYGRYLLEIQAAKVTKAGKPCLEFKVLKAEKTQANEPHRVDDVVSYIENVSDPKSGGGSRMLKAVLAARDMIPADIATAEYTKDGKSYVAEGDAAQKFWIAKFFNGRKQPCAFLRVEVEVEPRVVEAKDGKPAATFSRELWRPAKLTEADLDEIEKKRAEAKLPNLADAMK